MICPACLQPNCPPKDIHAIACKATHEDHSRVSYQTAFEEMTKGLNL